MLGFWSIPFTVLSNTFLKTSSAPPTCVFCWVCCNFGIRQTVTYWVNGHSIIAISGNILGTVTRVQRFLPLLPWLCIPDECVTCRWSTPNLNHALDFHGHFPNKFGMRIQVLSWTPISFFWIPMFNGMNETYQETMTLEPPKYGELFEYLKFYLYPQSPVSSSSPPKYHFQQIPQLSWRNRSLRSRWKMRWSERSTAPRSTGY